MRDGCLRRRTTGTPDGRSSLVGQNIMIETLVRVQPVRIKGKRKESPVGKLSKKDLFSSSGISNSIVGSLVGAGAGFALGGPVGAVVGGIAGGAGGHYMGAAANRETRKAAWAQESLKGSGTPSKVDASDGEDATTKIVEGASSGLGGDSSGGVSVADDSARLARLKGALAGQGPRTFGFTQTSTLGGG